MTDAKGIFAGRKILIASKHHKEKVMAPLLESNLGVECIVNSTFDTDILGTFSGEVERKDDPVTTLRQKCLMAMELSSIDLVVANEGSFGPHPAAVFTPADDEFVMLIDRENDLEIMARELSTETNFHACEVHSEKELMDFAKGVAFPSHAIILRRAQNDNSRIIKDNLDWDQLRSSFNELIKDFGTVYAETDMRAMNNPTRMKVIERATLKLIEKINSLCPKCSCPGFAISKSKTGLPCGLCGFPTNSILSYIYHCEKCDYSTEIKYPHQMTAANPMYCDSCNP